MNEAISTLAAKRDELAEGLIDGMEAYCESVAEHNGEVICYGDAGPGSGHDLGSWRRSLIGSGGMVDSMTRALVKMGWEPQGTWGSMDVAAQLPVARSPR